MMPLVIIRLSAAVAAGSPSSLPLVLDTCLNEQTLRDWNHLKGAKWRAIKGCRSQICVRRLRKMVLVSTEKAESGEVLRL